MKKRFLVLLSVVLCTALLLAVLPGPASAAKVSFIAVNDLLPPELVNCSTVYGGSVYVPYTVFTSYGLGVGYSYFSEASTAYLYSGSADLFFDIPNGRCYDSDDYQYSAPAILYGGRVYVPLSFTAGFFGLGLSYIPGNDYGSILRLTNGAQVLDDAEFLSAAGRIMREYSQAYDTPATTAPTATPAESAEPSETPAPTDSPRPTETPEPTPESNHAEDTLTLSFLGLPDTEVLELMTRQGLSATVFLREEDIRERADDVRRVVCSGWGVGVCCDRNGALERKDISALLFDAARIRSVLVSAPAENEEACRGAARQLGLAYAGVDVDASGAGTTAAGAYAYTQRLGQGGDHSVRLSGSAEDLASLEALLRYVQEEQFRIALCRESGGAD